MSRLATIVLFLAGIFGAFTAAGCAYTYKNTLPAHIKTIEVSTFGNSTFYQEVEGILTRDVITQINLTPGLKVVNSKGDATLTGEIISVEKITISWDSNNQPNTQQVAITVRFSLYDNHDNSFLYQDIKLTNTQNSSSAGILHVDQGQSWASARDAALDELAKQLIRSLNDKW